MQDMEDWLERIGLGQHYKALVDNDVDFAVLRLLTEADLRAMGLSLGHRKRLLKAVADLDGAAAGDRAAASSPLPAEAPPAAAAVDPMLGAERRQLTVMFCDMVGFTELASRVDPEVLQGIVKRYSDACAEVIASYEGHVFQLLGDGVVAFFGYPQAHENEAERSIRAGLEIIERLQQIDMPEAGRLSVRIGIATGLVVVLPDNGGAVGDTMNLAARLQGMAAPGTVVTSAHVHRMAGAVVAFDSLGEHVLKGIPQPATVWRAVGLRHVESRFQAMRLASMLPLVGRQTELELLRDRWRQARAGRGQVVVISGEAGIGKSRLARALIDDRRAADAAWVVELQCSPFHMHSPLYPVAEFLRQRVFGEGIAGDNDDRWAALGRYLAGTQLPAADVKPILAQLLGIAAPADTPPSTLSPERARVLMRQTLLALVLDRARSGPGIYLMEDLHWADPSTLELTSFLIEHVCDAGVLMVLTHRPDFAHPLPKQLHVSPLHVGRLAPNQAEELVRLSCRDAGLPADLMRRMVEKTDGVPLYIEEFSQAIVESRRAAIEAAVAEVVIPASLRDTLFARLDLLGSAKGVAQLASMLGREFGADVLAASWPGDRASLKPGLVRLVEAGFILRAGPVSRQRYIIKHALIQDAAYESMLRSDRVAHHLRIALALEAGFAELVQEQPEMAARHFAAGHIWDKAAALWLAAGQLALRRNAHVEAVAHLRSALGALATVPESPERALSELDIQLTLGTALVAAKGYASADVEATWGRAHQLCAVVGVVPQRIPALFGLWMFNTVGARHLEADVLAKEIVQLSEALGSDDLMIEAQLGQGITNFFLGHFDAAIENFERVAQLYVLERHGGHCFQFGQDPAVVALIFQCWIYWVRGEFARSLDAGSRGVACASALGHPFTLSYANAFVAWHRVMCREFDSADEVVVPLIRLCTDEDIPVFLANALVVQSWVQCERSAGDGAGRLQSAVDVFRSTGSRCFLPYWVSYQADHLASCGDLVQARRLMDSALQAAEATAERWAQPEVLRLDMLLRQRMGASLQELEAGLRQSLDIAAELGARAWTLRTSLSLAQCLVSQGRPGEARQALQQALHDLPPGRGAMPGRDVADAEQLMHRLS